MKCRANRKQQLAKRQPTRQEIAAAAAVFADTGTRWHAADDLLRQIVERGIAVARAEQGMTQSQLAAGAGLSQPQVSRIEADPESAPVVTLRRIAEALAKTSRRRAG